VGGHADAGALRQLAERREVRLQLLRGGGHHRQLEMAVGPGAAVARHMLHDAGDAAFGEALDHHAPERCDLNGVAAERALAHHRMRARVEQVEHRRAGDIDAGLRQHHPVASPLTRAASSALIGARS
jgi:hypothetical protein